MTDRKSILVFCDYYLPSLGGGGGMRYLANLIDRFSDRFDFFIVANNRNNRLDLRPLEDVVPDAWTTHGNANVYYFSRRRLTASIINRIVQEVGPEIVFLNSVFSTPSVKFLWERSLKGFANIGVIISPCGELLSDALKGKSIKKRFYLFAANLLGFYRNVVWRASSERERAGIEKVIGSKQEIYIAPDLTPKLILPDFNSASKPFKKSGDARFAFLSRIVPNKNLDFILRLLGEIKSANITFDIIGSAEKAAYWSECAELIQKLPANIDVNVSGALQNEIALAILCKAHFFILPTERENFGYVLIEALSAGCPLIISDRTDWNNIEKHDAGWCIPLDDLDAWSSKIDQCVQMNNEDYRSMSASARGYAENYFSNNEAEKKTLELLARSLKTILNG